ncbi:MAG: CCA tRNA nucleotidyltransferase, partial [Alphaproteobacteria bacterium]
MARAPADFPVPWPPEWLADPDLRRVTGMLERAGHQAWIVGGAVRNALLGLDPGDIDIATDARPERVMALAEAEGLRAVPTGFDHGTVTVVSGGRGFEVTTFRRDVATDGRRAVVAFSDRLEDDARRRDFTINALYLAPDGRLVDPVGGLTDLRARRIRFIGDPATRIREDYLRILRFFRFHAWYGDPERGLDPEGLAAVRALADGLGRLSAERIGTEMRKLLAAPDPAAAVAAMAEAGVLGRILPGADPALLAALVAAERRRGMAPAWLRRLAALGVDPDLARERLRLSRAEHRHLVAVARLLERREPVRVRAWRAGAEAAIDAALIDEARGQGHPADTEADLRAEAEAGAQVRMPLRAADRAERLQGPALGRALRAAEEA